MIYLVVVCAIALRFIPHMANLAPVTALAIFAAAYLPKKQAIVLPLVARLISDLFLGFFAWPLMVAVYAAHLFGSLLGLWIRRSNVEGTAKWFRILASGLFSSAFFFLLTNFALLYKEYPHTLAGVMLAYTNGLPFLRGTIIGDVAYVVVLFGGYELVRYAGRLIRARRTLALQA